MVGSKVAIQASGFLIEMVVSVNGASSIDAPNIVVLIAGTPTKIPLLLQKP